MKSGTRLDMDKLNRAANGVTGGLKDHVLLDAGLAGDFDEPVANDELKEVKYPELDKINHSLEKEVNLKSLGDFINSKTDYEIEYICEILAKRSPLVMLDKVAHRMDDLQSILGGIADNIRGV